MDNLMDFESLVMDYLSAQGLFLAPQFSLRDGGREWSCPDFVALDFRACEIQVVEVTTAYNVRGLIEKIQKREDQWFLRLRPQLLSLGIPVHNWKSVVRAFVRRERAEYVKSKILNADDVKIEIIEDIAIPWSWPWDQWKAQSGAEAGAPQAPRR
ncbi:hypothetical protein [Amphibiibacter pelophylacis]|uniref:Uncharacterized protein n=1 Tax=Amphibiibacter pelophylacis TaxID=1799477 RepID=A0ACC6P3J0_9BURK